MTEKKHPEEVFRIAVFVSGGGTNLQAIIDRIHSGDLGCVQIIKVISSNEHAPALRRAENNNIPYSAIKRSVYATEEEFTQALLDDLGDEAIDLIVLAGFLSKIGPAFFRRFPNVINVHPSLIPSFCGHGMYGLKVHEAVLKAGVKITGATVHRVDEDYDSGPILFQIPVSVMDGDTPESLQKRVMLEGEQVILPQAIRWFAQKKCIEQERGTV